MPKCNLCGEGPITWARTEAGKGMPVWSRPDPRGTGWYVGTGKERRLRVASAAHPRPDTGPFYRPHFLDCAVYAAKKRLEARLKAAMKELEKEAG